MFGSGYDIILMMLMLWSGYKASSRIGKDIEYKSMYKEDIIKLELKKALVFSMPLILIVVYSCLGLVDVISVIMSTLVYSFIKLFETVKESRELDRKIELENQEITELEEKLNLLKLKKDK